jgi:hypothetical protein
MLFFCNIHSILIEFVYLRNIVNLLFILSILFDEFTTQGKLSVMFILQSKKKSNWFLALYNLFEHESGFVVEFPATSLGLRRNCHTSEINHFKFNHILYRKWTNDCRPICHMTFPEIWFCSSQSLPRSVWMCASNLLHYYSLHPLYQWTNKKSMIQNRNKIKQIITCLANTVVYEFLGRKYILCRDSINMPIFAASALISSVWRSFSIYFQLYLKKTSVRRHSNFHTSVCETYTLITHGNLPICTIQLI